MRAFERLLGAKLTVAQGHYGYLAVIRGCQHFFPSLTHVYDAAAHGTGGYQL